MVDLIVEYSSFEKHNTPIFTGLKLLANQGLISIKTRFVDRGVFERKDLPVMFLLAGGKKIIIDTYDGYRFDHSLNIEDNLFLLDEVLKKKCDYYFKRSYKKSYVMQLKNAHKMQHLGLNYPMTNELMKEDTNTFSAKNVKRILGNIPYLNKVLHLPSEKDTSFRNFEGVPKSLEELLNEPTILFLTRMWDPNELSLPTDLIEERLIINNYRASCIRACKAKFGDRFVGGVQGTKYAKDHFPDLIVPRALTNRATFLKIIRNASVCIATTGLHNSIGWKMAEYVAAAKAIVTEPLFYEVDEYFKEGTNYLSFRSETTLLEAIDSLVQHPEKVREIMVANHHYYKQYLRPDQQMLNLLRNAKVL